MAQLSRLAQLYLKISDNLTEKDVRNLRSLLAVDEILGKAKTEEAIPLEIFNMLKDNGMIGKGNLGLLVQVLRCLGKGELAKEAECLEQEHKMEGKEIHETTAMTPESNASEDELRTSAVTVTRDRASEDSEPENTEVKEIIFSSVQNPPAASDKPDYHNTTDTDVHGATSELASLHIRELVRLRDEPMKALGPSEPDSSTGVQDAKSRLETLLAELVTPAVLADQEQQCDLYCQIGDLYRAKLYNLQLALQYYQSMLECSKSLSENNKQAKAHNRLGLTYDIIGKHEEATKNHERVLEICKDVGGDEVDICVAYKNLATSLTLSSKVSHAKTNYKTALRFARKTGNKLEEIDIHCRLGDLNRQQLKEPQLYYKNYTNMLELATELGSKYWKMLAYDRLGLACNDMQDNEDALQWYQKALEMSKESADKRDHIITRMNVGVLLGKVQEAKSHLDTALQMAQQKGDEYGQMSIYVRMGDMQREKLNSPRTAIQYYEQALALARQLGDRRQEEVAYNRLGLAHYAMEEYDAALECHHKDLKIGQEDGDKTKQITAHQNVADAYKSLGKLDQARSHYQSSLTIAMETGNKQEQMNTYLSLGDLHREQLHKPQESHKYYTEMLALAKDLGRKDKERLAYNRLGLACEDMQDNEAALEWHQKNLKMSQEDDNKITAHQNTARTYKALGKLDQARSHHQSALTIAMETGNKQEQMDIYLSLGDLHREQLHEPQASHKYYTEMLVLANDLGRKDKERLAYNRLGLACGDMQDNEAALEWHQKNLEMNPEDGDKTEQIASYYCIAHTYTALGKLDQARSHYQSALTIAMETGNKQEQENITEALGKLDQPRSHSQPATAIAMETRHKQEHEDITEVLGKLDQVSSSSQPAAAIGTETQNKQEQKKIRKKLSGRQSCKTS